MPQDRNSFGNRVNAWSPALDDMLCAYVETDLYSFGEIAKRMGLGRDQVTSRWRRIVTRMGPQAV